MRTSLAIFATWPAFSISSAMAIRPFGFLDRRLHRPILRPHDSGQTAQSDLDLVTQSKPEDEGQDTKNDLLVGNGTFDQWIDHNNHELGTFKQTFFWNATFWKGEGYPVLITSSGLVTADSSWFSPDTMIGRIAEELGAAMLEVEHRYFGTSTPFTYMSNENLTYLTIEQAAADYVRFAQESKLPFDITGSSTSLNAPWIYASCAYGGTLGAYIEALHPGTFYINYLSSAGAESIYDNWYYQETFREYMPQNCSKAVQAIVEEVDNVLMHGTPKQQYDLKAKFLMGDIPNDDAAGYISATWGEWWQQIQPQSFRYPEDNGVVFYQMCDTILGVANESSTSPNVIDPVVSVEQAIDNFAPWFQLNMIYGICGDGYNAQCLNSHNLSQYQDKTYYPDVGLQYDWMGCTWPLLSDIAHPPDGIPSLISRYMTPEYHTRHCPLTFPGYDFGNFSCRTDEFNAKTGGWDFVGEQRVIWVTGAKDVWRQSGVASKFRPGGPFHGNDHVRSIIPAGGFYCSDMVMEAGDVNSDVRAAQNEVLAQIVEWTKGYYEERGLEYHID